MSDCDSVENKRKRQDSIKDSKILLESPITDCAELAAAATEEEIEDNGPIPVAGVAASPAGGSSPVKRPRTSEDGDSSPQPNNAEEAKEAAESVQDKVKGISMEDAPKKPAAALPIFGSAFGVSGKPGGFSSFASAAKKASPFAAFTTATSGFAKYATAAPSSSLGESSVSVEGEAAAVGSDSEDVAGNEDLDDDDEVRAPPAGGSSQRTFEDLLTTKGKETLQLHGSLSSPHVSTPLTAHGVPSTPVRTFEEDETCLFSTKAKLFELQDATWKERGGGQFKINSKIEQPDKCRLLMRTDLTFRLILNVPLFHGLKAVCERRFVRFTCFDVESKLPITYVLRFATDALAADAYVCISKNTPEDSNDDDDDDDKHSTSASENSDDSEEEEEEEEGEEEEEEVEEKVEDQGEAKEDEEESADVAEEEEEEASQSEAESQAEQQSSAAEEDGEEEEEAQDDASAASASASDNDDGASGQEQSDSENEESDSE
ncbi:hypothetical protein GGF41_001323 [Coemansia sp. RSA 2531]|nr:hypothetical protein GGF41_001323 [Coemansia sp. RSA 2531]